MARPKPERVPPPKAARPRVRAGATSGGRVKVDTAALMREAERARLCAYAPYSGFAVGAAVLTASGRVVRGSNVENASFGLTICAERSAMFSAVGDGLRDFVAIAIAGPPGPATPPCGACRQVLMELAPRITVYFRDAQGRLVRRTALQLLPDAFALGGRRR